MLRLVTLLLLAARDPYVSSGFLTIPPEVKLGPMSAVEADSAGHIYVLHRGEPPLLQFSSDGTYQKGFGNGLFKVAHGLRADRQGHIWTTDNGNHVIREFSAGGELLRTIGEVNVAGADGTHFKSPDDLVFGRDGDIYVADSGNGRIAHLDREGRFLGQFGKKGKGPGEFATAHGLAIDAGGRIYVADRGNQRVQVFDREGQFLSEWNGFGNPFGLLVTGGQLLVSEGDVNRIFHLSTKSGEIVEQWGGPETLQLPHLMTVDRQGRLYVAEVNGKRVQIFRKAP